MKGLKLIGIFWATVVIIGVFGNIAYSEIHHVQDCTVCHYAGDAESTACTACPNNSMIKCVINIPPSGDPTETTFGPYVTGEEPYNGVCEVCHTQTAYHTNTGNGSSHFDGSNCIPCHPHRTQPDLFSPLAVVGLESHETHISEDRGPGVGDCNVCHLDTENYSLFADGEPLATTSACDTCHSPSGAFDGSQMAKGNWEAGIYTAEGDALQSGKEQWCGSCHDDEPANSKSDGSGVNAPSVIGDDTTYGFYLTGHGANGLVKCLDCHDADKTHIDHEHRTYEVDEVPDPDIVVNSYGDSYRLKDNDGLPSMAIPRPTAGGYNPIELALCFSCHNADEVLGVDQNKDDYSHTNFIGLYPTKPNVIGNAHQFHLVVDNGGNADSDWDWVQDSRTSCITCHNVHGPPNGAMIRHGELISTYGVTPPDKVPAFDFTYLSTPTGGSPATASFTSSGLPDGDYEVYAWWNADSYAAQDAVFTIIHDGGSDVEVSVDQTINGGQWNRLGTGTYTYNTGTGTIILDNDNATGGYVVADAIEWRQVVGGSAVVTLDTLDASFEDDHFQWNYQTGRTEAYNDDRSYIYSHFRGVPDSTATLLNSTGGWMRHGQMQFSSNGVCQTCHYDGHARYDRDPKFWPKVITMPGAEADRVPNDGTGSSLITVTTVDPDDNVSSVTIDLSPIGGSSTQPMNNNGDGTYSHQASFPSGIPDQPFDFEITATDSDANTGTGVITVIVVDPDAIYIDDMDAIFVPECLIGCDYQVEWKPGAGYDQQYGSFLHYKEIGDGSGTATWTPDMPAAGNYRVYAWWMDHNGKFRSENVPYTINYDGGSDTVYVDQTDNGPGGGQWNLLGAYPFAAGTLGSVVLSDDATTAPIPGGVTVIVADAVKLVLVP